MDGALPFKTRANWSRTASSEGPSASDTRWPPEGVRASRRRPGDGLRMRRRSGVCRPSGSLLSDSDKLPGLRGLLGDAGGVVADGRGDGA